MANFRDINGASRQLNRVTDIKLQEDNRVALEAVMVALAASGRVQEMAVIAQTLEKTTAETDLVGAIGDLKTVIQGIKQPVQTQAEDSVTLTKEQYDDLLHKAHSQ
jgi:hypothetical protein